MWRYLTLLLFFLFLILVTQSFTQTSASPRSLFFTASDGVRLHYLQAGSGPTIIFVPGWTMPAEIWEPQIEYFSSRYKVLALDPRSQGGSDRANDGNYPEKRAQDIKEFVDQCQSEVVLVGWSMGVTELLNYANQFGTTNIRAFVLVDGFVQLDPKWRTFHWSLIKQIQEDRAAQTAQFVRWMYKKPQPEDYLQRVIAASLRTPTNTAVALMANLIRQDDWRSMLAKIDKPVFYVVRLDFQEQTEILRATLPSARVEVFEDAGHALFVDDSERFNNSLQGFLNTVWAAKP